MYIEKERMKTATTTKYSKQVKQAKLSKPAIRPTTKRINIIYIYTYTYARNNEFSEKERSRKKEEQIECVRIYKKKV